MNNDIHVVFIDETGFMLNPLIRRSWSPRGQTPIIKISNSPHDRISVIGAMTISLKTRQFGWLFHLAQDNTNFRGYSIVHFLDRVHNKFHNGIRLVWDSIKIHTAEPVTIYLNSHSDTRVFFFPEYAPELNPVDNVWGYIKYDRLANFCPHNLAELRRRVRAELLRVQKMPYLLESLFRHTGLEI